MLFSNLSFDRIKGIKSLTKVHSKCHFQAERGGKPGQPSGVIYASSLLLSSCMTPFHWARPPSFWTPLWAGLLGWWRDPFTAIRWGGGSRARPFRWNSLCLFLQESRIQSLEEQIDTLTTENDFLSSQLQSAEKYVLVANRKHFLWFFVLHPWRCGGPLEVRWSIGGQLQCLDWWARNLLWISRSKKLYSYSFRYSEKTQPLRHTSTPGVSPIATPSKKDPTAVQFANSAPITEADMAPLTENSTAQQNLEASTQNGEHSSCHIPDGDETEHSDNANSMIAEPGTELASQNVTAAQDTSRPSHTETEMSSNKSWHPTQRWASVKGNCPNILMETLFPGQRVLSHLQHNIPFCLFLSWFPFLQKTPRGIPEGFAEYCIPHLTRQQNCFRGLNNSLLIPGFVNLWTLQHFTFSQRGSLFVNSLHLDNFSGFKNNRFQWKKCCDDAWKVFTSHCTKCSSGQERSEYISEDLNLVCGCPASVGSLSWTR